MMIVPFSFIRMGISSGSVVDPWRIFHKSSIPCEEKKKQHSMDTKEPQKSLKDFLGPDSSKCTMRTGLPQCLSKFMQALKALLPTVGCTMAGLTLVVLILTGCTPEKARFVRLAAEQFSNQALIAVNAVEKTMQAEFAPSARSPREQTDDFVAFLAGLDLDRLREAGIELGFSNLEQAADPDVIGLDPAVKAAREQYLTNLRTRYATFAETLQGLEEGSFLSSEAVAGSVKLANRLTSDMAGLARHFASHPPRLLQQRSSLVADTLDILEQKALSRTLKEDRLAFIKVRFDAIRRAEQDLQREVVASSLKSAKMGLNVQTMVEAYTRLSGKAMQDLLLQAIRSVGSLTGRGMPFLAARAEAVFRGIRADPAFKAVAGEVMSELRQTAEP